MTMPAGDLSPIEHVLDVLTNHGSTPRKTPGGWTAKCPAHDDASPSMSIAESESGNVLLCCHAGCLTHDITQALGLTFTNLFPEKPPKIAHIGPNGRLKARYLYADETGNILSSVARYDPKTFRQHRADGLGGWLPGIEGVRRLLYRLPQVLRAKNRGTPIWIVEGEKDVENLDHYWGYVATTNPGGADNGTGNKWLPEHTATLTGAPRIGIIADRDNPGRRHARYIARQLAGTVGRVAIFEAATGKDATDHIRAGRGPGDLIKTWDSQTDPLEQLTEPDNDLPPDATEGQERPPSSWAPIDLDDALDGTDIPPPTILRRTDGHHLLYPGRIHWFQGEPESLKTWLALQAVHECITQGLMVLFVDFEDDDRGIVARLYALGLTRDQIKTRLVYIRPEEPLSDRRGKITSAALDLADVEQGHDFALAVVDGITEAMTVEGLDLMSNTDIAVFMRLLPRRLAATGAAVICLDHVVKSRENQGRWALGGQHKLAGLTGAAYGFEVIRPLARALVEPHEATVRITVQKDRPGHIRGLTASDDKHIATMLVTSHPEGHLTIEIEPPGKVELRIDLEACHAILSHLKIYNGESRNRLEEALTGTINKDRIPPAVAWMEHEDRRWISVERTSRGHLHWINDQGRKEAE